MYIYSFIIEQEYNMPVEISEQFKKMIMDTKRTGLEYGVGICENGELDQTCEGTTCSVGIKKKKCERHVADFHTHPDNHPNYKNFFSSGDFASTNYKKSDYHCVGAINDDKPYMNCSRPANADQTFAYEQTTQIVHKLELKHAETNDPKYIRARNQIGNPLQKMGRILTFAEGCIIDL